MPKQQLCKYCLRRVQNREICPKCAQKLPLVRKIIHACWQGQKSSARPDTHREGSV